MRTEIVEIYSDDTNRAVMRHPGRKFPGMLIQGNTLFAQCAMADEACAKDGSNKEFDRLHVALLDLLLHYKSVLVEHEIRVPFDERPRFLDR